MDRPEESMMPVPFESDDVKENVRADDGGETLELKAAAGAELSSVEASEVWPQVLEHKWYMSERLGRDVGLRVATVDYFTNVRRVTKRDEMREMQPPTLPFMRPFGYR
jgi:transitional endoplasmic reticulum ATPase